MYLRNAFSDRKLNDLAFINTKQNVVKELNLDDIISTFAAEKVRRGFRD